MSEGKSEPFVAILLREASLEIPPNFTTTRSKVKEVNLFPYIVPYARVRTRVCAYVRVRVCACVRIFPGKKVHFLHFWDIWDILPLVDVDITGEPLG